MALTGPSDPAATARPCPYCGIAVTGPHEACAGLFKAVMSGAPESSLDEVPPEVQPYVADESRWLDDYILVDQVGKGGMGTVWKAWDRKLTRYVAIKFLNGQDADDLARFSREAKLAARLRHPNIAAVFDTGEVPSKQAGQDPVRYLAMEFIEGQSVASAELPLNQWLEIFARVCRAVDHAHKSGVVHRDLKPSNLMLTAEKWPYVMDFGLAKSLKAGSSVSMSGIVLGTPAFMPPEQASGKLRETDQLSDIYSLGATLYFVLTRREPYKGEDSMDILLQVIQTEPPRPREVKPELPEGVEAVILKAMSRNKSDRYASAADLALDLERLVEGKTPELPPARSRRPALILGGLALVVAAGFVGALSRRPPEPAQAPVAGPAPLQKPSPLPGFLTRFRELKEAKQWRAGLAWVGDGIGFLTAPERADYTRELEEGCRDELHKVTAAFCSGVLTDRLEQPGPDFKFASLAAELPKADQLILPHPAYDWTVALLPKLDDSKPEALLQAAAAAVALDDAGENPWFSAAQSAAYRALTRDLRKQTDRARGAARSVVQECRAAADALAKPWDDHLKALAPAFRKRHAGILEGQEAAVLKARAAFPVDAPYLETIDFARILNGPNAEARLMHVEAQLRAQIKPEELTRESHHLFLVSLVTLKALQGAFDGRSADDVVAGLQSYTAALKSQGVSDEEKSKFGPKVAAVFERLLR